MRSNYADSGTYVYTNYDEDDGVLTLQAMGASSPPLTDEELEEIRIQNLLYARAQMSGFLHRRHRERPRARRRRESKRRGR
jgi:hypothetical protein